MPKIITRTLLILILLAMFPPLVVALKRSRPTDLPPLHPIQDMDNQVRLRAQHEFEFFADGRAMRAHPAGTVARGGLRVDDHFYRGLVDGQWATSFPEQATMSDALLARGQERFNIYCSPCHGESGNGLGMVAVRAATLLEQGEAPTWVAPKPVFDPETLKRPIGELFNIVTHGINTMSGYGGQIPEADRWAIVAWVKVLQQAGVGSWDDVPAEQVERLQTEQREAREEAAREAAEEAAKQAARDANSQNAGGDVDGGDSQ
ncbi:MAG: c-type cytochrome [Phycisphaerales bacterium]